MQFDNLCSFGHLSVVGTMNIDDIRMILKQIHHGTAVYDGIALVQYITCRGNERIKRYD